MSFAATTLALRGCADRRMSDVSNILYASLRLQYDKLADHLRECLNMDLMYREMGIG